MVIHTLVKISFSFWWLNWYNINISSNCCDSEVPIPVWIVHVFLSYFVRLGVHVDWVLRLGAHVVLPDNAALLRHLGLIGINSLNLLFCEKNLNKTSDAGSFFKCHTDSTKRRFSVAYSFSRNDKKWSRPSGSFSSSQPEETIEKLLLEISLVVIYLVNCSQSPTSLVVCGAQANNQWIMEAAHQTF